MLPRHTRITEILTKVLNRQRKVSFASTYINPIGSCSKKTPSFDYLCLTPLVSSGLVTRATHADNLLGSVCLIPCFKPGRGHHKGDAFRGAGRGVAPEGLRTLLSDILVTIRVRVRLTLTGTRLLTLPGGDQTCFPSELIQSHVFSKSLPLLWRHIVSCTLSFPPVFIHQAHQNLTQGNQNATKVYL